MHGVDPGLHPFGLHSIAVDQYETYLAATPRCGVLRPFLSDISKEQPMNGYKAFYKGLQCEVMADTSYEAQKKAAAILKAKKSYEVTVMLCKKNGEQVVHAPLF